MHHVFMEAEDGSRTSNQAKACGFKAHDCRKRNWQPSFSLLEANIIIKSKQDKVVEKYYIHFFSEKLNPSFSMEWAI
jgi:hypothetical protein